MEIYNVKTREDYDELMVKLEEKGYKWLSGKKPTSKNYWIVYKEKSCIIISSKYITFMNIEQSKKQHPNIPIIEYKAKGENMTQEEMKHNLHELEPALQDTKSSAKNLIEKIDDLIEKIDATLETLKPKFKVGDYVTLDIHNKKIAKIERLNGALHGLWYDRESENIKQDFYFGSRTSVRHARPTEIAEYKVALTFHKHGRKPFEVKDGDILLDDEGNILINDDNILSADFPKNLKKHYFTSGKYTFLKTVEEVNEWLENK